MRGIATSLRAIEALCFLSWWNKLNNLATALVYAFQYIAVDRNDEEYTEDDDIKVAEQLASLIQTASEEEKKILLKISKKLGFEHWGGQVGLD